MYYCINTKRKVELLKYTFDNDRPIYVQIVERLKLDVLNGKYLPGSKMPSVRELALLFNVNPNTMQKAMGELEEVGLIKTVRTAGRYVTEDKKLISNIRNGNAKKLLKNYFEGMLELGYDKNQASEFVKKEGDK